MNARGPIPKPTAIKIMEGNPSKSALPKYEPKPPAVALQVPEWLSPDAKQIWERYYQQYASMKLLASVDEQKFGLYCQTLAQIIECQKLLNAEGQITGNKFNRKQHPAHKVLLGLMEKFIKLGHEFGDSPAARARLMAVFPETGEEQDELQSFLQSTTKEIQIQVDGEYLEDDKGS